jgi:hypothetical protein
MTRKEAINQGFTHLCKMYGFKCYVNFTDDGGAEVEGTNWMNTKMIDVFAWIDANFAVNHAFPILIIEELT